MKKKQSPNIAMRFSSQDKAMLRELARVLGSSQVDTVRLLVRGAYTAVAEKEPREPKPAQELAAN